jgi:DNA mismatch repair protein MutS2
MKITLPESDLMPAESNEQRQSTPRYGYTSDSGTAPAAFSLDVRGERLDEALDRVNRQIDNATLANLYEFEIIHGKGEGVLQTGVQRLLQESPQVEEFYFSRPEQGGTGK